MPALAICQAASEPARPPPITWTVSVWGVVEIMRAGLARFRAQAHRFGSESKTRQTKAGNDNARSEAGVIRSSGG